jgi:ribosome-associated toxin RatA of RatAB toxin-antitoxin module
VIGVAWWRRKALPTIELRKVIPAPLEAIVEIARDIEAYPQFMPDVKSVKILEQSEDGSRQRAEWVGVIKQFAREIRWVQEDRWVAPNRVEFSQVEGDYDKMEGYWEFNPVEGGTEFVNFLDYEYKVPLLGALVTKVVDYLVRQNLNGIMDSIERRSTQPV